MNPQGRTFSLGPLLSSEPCMPQLLAQRPALCPGYGELPFPVPDHRGGGWEGWEGGVFAPTSYLPSPPRAPALGGQPLPLRFRLWPQPGAPSVPGPGTPT